MVRRRSPQIKIGPILEDRAETKRARAEATQGPAYGAIWSAGGAAIDTPLS
jgi:hypothetical protein